MIPQNVSGEARHDAEPNIAVNPENPRQIIATAFTRDPLNGSRAPIFTSNDGGDTWSLRSIVPGGPITADISVGYGDRGGALYAGTLNASSHDFNVLRTLDPFSTTLMTLLVDRAHEDQPWVTAATARTADADQDRVCRALPGRPHRRGARRVLHPRGGATYHRRPGRSRRAAGCASGRYRLCGLPALDQRHGGRAE